MKSRFFLIIFLKVLLFCNIYANDEYKIETGKYTYISITIVQNQTHLLFADAVCKEFNLEEYNKDDLNSFLNCLFQDCFFVPDIYFAYPLFLKKYNIIQSDLETSEFISRFYREKKKVEKKYTIILFSGDQVKISLFNIEGSFWVIDKNNNHIIKNNSISINIDDILSVQECFIPATITKFLKYKKEKKNAKYKN